MNINSVTIMAVTMCLAGSLFAQDELTKRASWSPADPEAVKLQVESWIAELQLDEQTSNEVKSLWSADSMPGTGAELLEHVALTIAKVDAESRPLVELCRNIGTSRVAPPTEILFDESRSPFERANLRLYFAVWLAQHRFYDEALELLDGLTHEDVVDPASLLFYQSVVHHRLLDKQHCLESLELLLENENAIPRRYVSVAKLMEADIKPLKEDSLDEVARLMDDIQRRLDLGRAGTRVRDEEEDVIAKLDKMIEDLEKQRKQGKSGASGANSTLQPSKPADDSQAMGGKGPGNVDQKRLKNEEDWGNLPPKERQEALQQISKDLPAHFRDVIEEYFRKLARDGGS